MEVFEHIRADYEKKLVVGVSFFELLARYIRIAYSAPFDFVIGHLDVRNTAERKTAHIQSVRGGSRHSALFVGGQIRRNNYHLVEPFERRGYDIYMFVMDGIERPAE